MYVLYNQLNVVHLHQQTKTHVMDINKFKSSVREISDSKQDNFTIETTNSINIHETKDCLDVFKKYETKVDGILSIKTGSHYGF